MVLTAHLSRGTEHIGHLLIHSDHDVLLGGYLPIADFDLVLDPVGEVILEYGGTDIADPLLAHLMDFLIIRHIVEYMPVTIAKEESDVLQRQTLVLGHLDVSDLGAKDAYELEESLSMRNLTAILTLLLLGHDIFQVSTS